MEEGLEKKMAENAMAIRMCKKVAQLTRVIYHLNTVNEDAVIERQKIKKQHEEELSEAISDGESSCLTLTFFAYDMFCRALFI